MPTGPVETSPALRTPLPGRRADIERIEREFARARDGETRFVLLTGEAGVGKTRLLRELARGTEMRALRLHLPPERVAPEDLLEDWLVPVLRGTQLRTDPRDLALAAAAYPRLAGLSPVAGTEAPVVPPARALAAVARLVAGAAERRPLLLLADDFPRLSLEVRRLVVELAVSLAGARVAFLAAARTGDGDPFLERELRLLVAEHLFHRIDVRPLDETGLGALVTAELDAGITAELLPWLSAKSRGNPLFAVELVRALQGQGILYVDRASGGWRLAGSLAEVPLPETIAHVLDTRRRTLPPDLARHLPALALLGPDAPASVLAPALAIDTAAIDEMRHRLVRAGVLELDREHSVMTFAHPLMVEHWREELDEGERRRLAACALDLVLAEIGRREGTRRGLVRGSCATGLELAREDELARVLAYANAAGGTADYLLATLECGWRRLRAQRPRAAAGWARRVSRRLRQLGDPEVARWFHAQLNFLMGSALGWAGRMNGAERRLRRFIATPEARDPGSLSNPFTRLGLYLIQRGRHDEARRVFEQGLAAVAGQEDARAGILRAVIHGYLSWIELGGGNLDAALAGIESARADLADLTSDPRAAAIRDGLLHDRAAVAAKRGDFRSAIADLEELVELQRGGPWTRCDSIANLAFNLAAAGELGRARTAALAALRAARRVERRVEAGAAAAALGSVEAAAARWPEAALAYAEAHDLAAQTAHREIWLFTTIELGRVHAAAGDSAASERTLDEAIRAIEGPAAAAGEGLVHYHWAQGWVHARRGEWEDARRASLLALAAADTHGATSRERAQIETAAVEIEARSNAGDNRLLHADLESLAARLAAVEPYLRAQDLHGELAELARVRIHLGLRGWQGARFPELVSEIETRLRRMEAPARWLEVAREFAGTEIALLFGDARPPDIAPGSSPVPAPIAVLDPHPPADRLRIRALGRLEVIRPGDRESLTRSGWGSRKARLILAYLLAEDPGGRGVTREALCEAVWPDSDSLTLDRTFRVTLTLLRKAVAAGAGAGARAAARSRHVVFENDLYRLDVGSVWCDARDFDRLIKQGAAGEREGDAAAAAALRRRAFNLYRGEFLADFDEIWIEPRRERLRGRFLGIGRTLCETALASKTYDEAQDIAERLVSCDPLAEEGHRLLIRVHQACGRRDAAARQLERCRAILSEALGLDVSADTVALMHPARKGSSA